MIVIQLLGIILSSMIVGILIGRYFEGKENLKYSRQEVKIIERTPIEILKYKKDFKLDTQQIPPNINESYFVKQRINEWLSSIPIEAFKIYREMDKEVFHLVHYKIELQILPPLKN